MQVVKANIEWVCSLYDYLYFEFAYIWWSTYIAVVDTDGVCIKWHAIQFSIIIKDSQIDRSRQSVFLSFT